MTSTDGGRETRGAAAKATRKEQSSPIHANHGLWMGFVGV